LTKAHDLALLRLKTGASAKVGSIAPFIESTIFSPLAPEVGLRVMLPALVQSGPSDCDKFHGKSGALFMVLVKF
jgi:hypothetical protein